MRERNRRSWNERERERKDKRRKRWSRERKGSGWMMGLRGLEFQERAQKGEVRKEERERKKVLVYDEGKL